VHAPGLTQPPPPTGLLGCGREKSSGAGPSAKGWLSLALVEDFVGGGASASAACAAAFALRGRGGVGAGG